MPKLSASAQKIIESPLRKIVEDIEKAGDDPHIISFGGGASNISPPPELITELITQLKNNSQSATAYGSIKGHFEVRKAIAEYIYEEQNIKIDPSTELMLTTGSTEAIFLALLAIIEPGDEVIITDPTYCYAEPLTLLGAKVIRFPVMIKDNFQINLAEIKQLISAKTKAFIMLNPDNPTGRILNKQNISELVGLAEKRNFWLISDETYSDIVYNKTFYPPRLFGGKKHLIVCGSLSKSACIPGLRIGYLYGPSSFLQIASALRQYTTMFPNKPSQIGAKICVKNKGSVIKTFLKEKVIPTYLQRRNCMALCLKQYLPHAAYMLPDAGFYFFVNINYYLKQKNISDKQFAEQLFQQQKVVAIPGSFFGAQGSGYLRLTFVAESEERIKEGFERISNFISSCNTP